MIGVGGGNEQLTGNVVKSAKLKPVQAASINHQNAPKSQVVKIFEMQREVDDQRALSEVRNRLKQLSDPASGGSTDNGAEKDASNSDIPWELADEGKSYNLGEYQVRFARDGKEYVRPKRRNPQEREFRRMKALYKQSANPASGGSTAEGAAKMAEDVEPVDALVPAINMPIEKKEKPKDSKDESSDETKQEPENSDKQEVKQESNDASREWRERNEKRRQNIERFYPGEANQAKRDKLKKRIDQDEVNPDRILNFKSPKMEGFSPQQQNEIVNILKMMPPELLIHIQKIKVMPEDEPRGVMGFRQNFKYRQGIVEIKEKTFDRPKDNFTGKVLHEIGGHGLVDMIGALDQKSLKKVMNLWVRTLANNPGMIQKDIYARQFVNGTEKPNNRIYGGLISESANEFWASRFAEKWAAIYAKAQGTDHRIVCKRDPNNQFTTEEEAAISEVFDQTIDIWRQVLVRNKLHMIHEN